MNIKGIIIKRRNTILKKRLLLIKSQESYFIVALLGLSLYSLGRVFQKQVILNRPIKKIQQYDSGFVLLLIALPRLIKFIDYLLYSDLRNVRQLYMPKYILDMQPVHHFIVYDSVRLHTSLFINVQPGFKPLIQRNVPYNISTLDHLCLCDNQFLAYFLKAAAID